MVCPGVPSTSNSAATVQDTIGKGREAGREKYGDAEETQRRRRGDEDEVVEEGQQFENALDSPM